MVYLSFNFYFFIALLMIFYYILPLKQRWWVLLAGSVGFYYWVAAEALGIFAVTIVVSFGIGLLLDKISRADKGNKHKASLRVIQRKTCLWIGIMAVLLPLLLVKHGNFAIQNWFHGDGFSWIVPLGISFYSMQITAYLVDIYYGKIRAQRDIWKYALFISFFPQIVQGPIPRYEQLGEQLYAGHPFEEDKFSKGLQTILWGFFLKFMIADKAGVVVDTIFDNFPMYEGVYVLVGGVLYSVQLYTDFLACVTISQGVAALFGIELSGNFKRPYLAISVKDFWRRWHISLSSWLRDYVYIPLGGNRKGQFVKYFNLMLTFAVSGIWHGTGYKFLFWGLLHGAYQIAGDLLLNIKKKMYYVLKISEGALEWLIIKRIGTFFWVMLAWIIFRAENLHAGLEMIWSIFSTYNPWVLFDDSLFKLGLGWKECMVLLLAILFVIAVEIWQEKMPEDRCVRDWLLEQHLIVRWTLYITVICITWVLGTYGFGFDAKDFIYGGF